MTKEDIIRIAVAAGFEEGWLEVCNVIPEMEKFAAIVAEEEREACERKLLLDLWDALPAHESTGDTAGSLRAMLMLGEVGDEIRERSNA